MNANVFSAVLQECTLRKVGAKECGYEEFKSLINAFIQYSVMIIGLLFVIVLIYMGFMYLTSGGDTGKVKKARDMLTKMAWGLFFTLCGWLIVYLILTQLKVDPEFYQSVLGS